MNTKNFRVLFLLFFVFYFIIGNAARLTARGEEQLYLISSWYLYSRVPAPVKTEFTIVVHKAGNQTFNPPVYLDNKQGVIFNQKLDYNHSLVHNVADLSRALQLENKSMILTARKSLEGNFILSPVVYDVVEISFNPIERWKDGSLLITRTIATFTSGVDE